GCCGSTARRSWPPGRRPARCRGCRRCRPTTGRSWAGGGPCCAPGCVRGRAPGRPAPGGSARSGPGPLADVGEGFAGAPDVLAVLDPLVDHLLADRGGLAGQPGYPVDDVQHEVEPVHVVAYQHVERCRGGALLLVSTDVDIDVVGAPVGQPVDQPRV